MMIYDQFSVHAPPDITKDTHIVAVCGCEPNDAAPDEDGWFLSDFFAFWHMFNGVTGPQQAWFHCLDMDALVQKHTRYLHGNPSKTRKVVLDANILAYANSMDTLRETPALSLKDSFQDYIGTKAIEADKTGANLLILMFGHGDRTTRGVFMGSATADMKDRGEKRTKFTVDALANKLKGYNVPTTILLTSCFSGGWTCHPNINVTSYTATGADDHSHSWRKTVSSGRACGSMFGTALVDRMTSTGVISRKSIIPSEPDEEQEDTIGEFSKSVYDSLLYDVDKKGMEHEFSFDAQDDAWGMCWGQRTGIPLTSYKQRWDALEDWQRDQTVFLGDPLNRDPKVDPSENARCAEGQYGSIVDYVLRAHTVISALAKVREQKQAGDLSMDWVMIEAAGDSSSQRKTSGLYGGSDQSLLNVVINLGEEYLASNPGMDDSGSDGGLHTKIRQVIDGTRTDPLEVESLLPAIQYRLDQMGQADEYLRLMDIDAPGGRSCCEFNTRRVRLHIDSATFSAYFRLLNQRPILFPDPNGFQGLSFIKGQEYLIIALHSGSPTWEQVEEKLDKLVAEMDKRLEHRKELVQRDPKVRNLRRNVYQAFGHDVGDASPTKRQSLSHPR